MTTTTNLPADDLLPTLSERLRTTVFEALGAASTCWENVAGAGVFDSTRAKQIGDELVAEIHDVTAFGRPSLGCATTAELTAELASRLSHPTSSQPEYRTVGGAR